MARTGRSGSIGRGGFLAAVAVLSISAIPVMAGEPTPLGDGSGTNNADLLSVGGCKNCRFASAPHERDAPPFDIDWSLSLRGAYVHDGEKGRFEALAIPRVTLRHETIRGGYALEADAELTKAEAEEYRIGALRLGLEGEYALDAVTDLSGELDLQLTQEAPGPEGDPAAEPLVMSGTAGLAAERRFGRLAVGVRAEGGRTVYGPTTLADGSKQDNSAQNNWTVEGGLRLGYEVTPLLTAFIDGSIGHQRYDAPSPIYLVALDATDYQLRTGLSMQWHALLEAEASVGLGLRRFAEPGFEDVVSMLYDAKLTFRPDETVALSAELATSVGAPGPDAGGTARVEYEATAAASYQVNPWLQLRASAGWRQAQLVGIDGSESGYSFGGGVDYRLNEHALLTADYGYAHEETTGEAATDEQRVTLGVTLHR